MKTFFLVVAFAGLLLAFEGRKHRMKYGKTSKHKLLCYLNSWAYYRPGEGKFDVPSIDPFLCSHAIYSSAKLQDNQIASYDPHLDLPDNKGLNGYGKFNALKKQNPLLTTLLSIGGWTDGSKKYSVMVTNRSSRYTFVKSVVSYLIKYGFDGLDLDWEYPAHRGGKPEDKQNFVLLLQELKAAFKPHGLLLTAAVAAGKSIIDSAYDIPGISEPLDFINLMTYDLHGSSDTVTAFNAPLRASYNDTESNKQLTVEFAVNYWLQGGAPKEKLIVGLAFFGISFTLKNEFQNGVNAPTSGPGTAGPFSGQKGVLGFNEICLNLVKKNWTEDWDDTAKDPFSFNGDQWVGYDNQKSISIKVDYLLNKGLAGGMVWSIDTDDFRGTCYGSEFFLLRVAAEKLL